MFGANSREHLALELRQYFPQLGRKAAQNRHSLVTETSNDILVPLNCEICAENVISSPSRIQTQGNKEKH